MITWNASDFNSLVSRIRESREPSATVLRYSRSDHARFIEATDCKGNRVPFNKAALTELQYIGTRNPYEDIVRYVQSVGTKVMDRYLVLYRPDGTSDCLMVGLQYIGTEGGCG